MALKQSNRVYTLSDAELCQFTSNLVNDMTRDITEFSSFGVDATAVSAMQTLGNAFEIFPSDEMYEGEVIIATDAKNVIRENIYASIRSLAMRVEIKWGINSGQYKRLGIKGIRNMSDIKLLFTARRVHTVMTEYLSALTAEGLTQTMLDDFEDLNESYELAMNLQHDKINARDIATTERIKKGNELYTIVAKYCDIGKKIWFNVDESKYNDYVIYPAVHTSLPKPQNVAAVLDPSTPPNITLTWDAVLGATNYDVYYNIANIGSPAGTFSLQDNYSSSPASIPSIINKRNYYKVRAKNETQTSSYSDEVFVDVPVS